jgi:DNA-nicking Smr family endonuclease
MARKPEELDLHGYTVAAAERVFEKYLDRARIEKKLIEVHFITGTGKIQVRFKELATQLELYHYYPLNNRGVIVIEFE